jgi:hypothetical protein
MIYISVVPFQWRWAFTIEDAQQRSLGTYKKMRRQGTYRIKIPMRVYSLKPKVSQKKFNLHNDTNLLGRYEAVARGGKWLITKL